MRWSAARRRLVILVLAGQPFGRQQARPVRPLCCQAQRSPPLVQAGGITYWPQLQGAVPDLILGSVDLRLAPVHQYPVHQVCQAGRAGVIPRHRVLEQGQALLLQIRRRVLGQQPGRVRARLASQPVAGSPIPADDLLQPRRVVRSTGSMTASRSGMPCLGCSDLRAASSWPARSRSSLLASSRVLTVVPAQVIEKEGAAS